LVAEQRSVDAASALECKALAVTLLSFVRPQTETWQFFKEKAAQLQAQIEDGLPAEIRTTAISRWENCTMEEMVRKVLDAVTTG